MGRLWAAHSSANVEMIHAELALIAVIGLHTASGGIVRSTTRYRTLTRSNEFVFSHFAMPFCVYLFLILENEMAQRERETHSSVSFS